MRRVLVASLVAVLGLVVVPVTAAATPGRGVTAVTIFDHVVGDTEYVLKEITIAPGGSTGWHYHPGPVRGVVERGVLSHNDSTCASDGVYHRGDALAEGNGPGYVHIGRNLGTKPVVLAVFYQNPVGAPLAVDAPNPGCAFE